MPFSRTAILLWVALLHHLTFAHAHVVLDYLQHNNGLPHFGSHIHRLNFGILLTPHGDGGSLTVAMPPDTANTAIYMSLITIVPGPLTLTMTSTDCATSKVTVNLTSSGQYGLIVPVSEFTTAYNTHLILTGAAVCVSRIQVLPHTRNDGIKWLYPDPAVHPTAKKTDRVRIRVPDPDNGALLNIFKGYVFRAQDFRDVVESKRVMLMLQKDMAVDSSRRTRCLRVRKSELFNDAFYEIMKPDPKQLKRPLSVAFSAGREKRGSRHSSSSTGGGDDIQADGLDTFFRLVFEVLFDPELYLFDLNQQNGLLRIHPESDSKQERYFRFAGRMIGLAIYNDVPMYAYFIPPLYKQLMNQPVTLQDMRHVDMQQHRVLNWVVESAVTRPFDKRSAEIDLEARVDQLWRSIMIEATVTQVEALKAGINEIVPLRVVSALISDPNELEYLMGGQMPVDLDLWRKFHTKVVNHVPSTHKQLKWFWRCLEAWDESRVIEFVKFVTGSDSFLLPTSGVVPWGHVFVLTLGYEKPMDSHVEVNTWSNTLYLPLYSSSKVMCTELWRAVLNPPST